MRIFITGGTGFVAKILVQKLTNAGHELTILTRSIKKGRSLPQGASFLEGNPTKSGPWQAKVAEHEVIINLAGASIFQRWTQKSKEAILDSRILATMLLTEALAARKGKATHFFSTSAVGYYGFHEDEILDEDRPPGEDFLAFVTSEWEKAALKAQKYGIRVVLCRFGIVLGKNGGALKKMLPLFKLGLGSQWFSWIHEEDLANIFLFLLENKEINGPINCCAPNPVRNREMSKLLGKALHRPVFLPPIPGFLLRLIMGESASVLLKGQRVLPIKLLNNGFNFTYPTLKEALQHLLINNKRS
jgi:uncharacterized protein (TIGR01777 family)